MRLEAGGMSNRVIFAPQQPFLFVGEDRNGAVSFDREIDTGETLASAPEINEITSGGPAITSVAINTDSSVTINDKTVGQDRAITFHADADGISAGTYTYVASATTDSSPAQHPQIVFKIDVIEVPTS
jgi:hypothetical protein